MVLKADTPGFPSGRGVTRWEAEHRQSSPVHLTRPATLYRPSIGQGADWCYSSRGRRLTLGATPPITVAGGDNIYSSGSVLRTHKEPPPTMLDIPPCCPLNRGSCPQHLGMWLRYVRKRPTTTQLNSTATTPPRLITQGTHRQIHLSDQIHMIPLLSLLQHHQLHPKAHLLASGSIDKTYNKNSPQFHFPKGQNAARFAAAASVATGRPTPAKLLIDCQQKHAVPCPLTKSV